MPKDGYHGITVKDDLFESLDNLSKNLGKTIPDLIQSLLYGDRYPKSLCVTFRSEYFCPTCGYRASDPSEKCPQCKGAVSVRYIKV